MTGKGSTGGGMGWFEHPVDQGVAWIQCDSWFGFNEYMIDSFAQLDGFIFRGQATTSWSLEPTFDRKLGLDYKNDYLEQRKAHLERFKKASRGMRGRNPSPIHSAYEWWALGQHHGLATPLLDWTESPFVAAFFAFASEPPKDSEPVSVVYALHKEAAERKSDFFKQPSIKNVIPDEMNFFLDFVRPDRDDNPRLIRQQGLFTIAPYKVSLVDWIRAVSQPGSGEPLLYKITVPSSERKLALKMLNWMNINYVSLYSDIQGASYHSNFNLEVKDY